MNSLQNKLLVVQIVSLMFLVNCGRGGGGSSDQSSQSPAVAEKSNCTDIKTFSDPAVISGDGFYQYRQPGVVTNSKGTFRSLTGNPVSAPIPFAEIEVTNTSTGEIIQCGNTDASGHFDVSVPKNSGSLSLKINSRAFNSKIKLSVLNDTTNNSPYYLESIVNVGSGNVSTGTLSATARLSESAKLEGGAFHILTSIYKANEYIRTQISDSGWVAEKVTVYWKAGFNPNSYFGKPNSGLSFYAPGDRKLYILGGLSGNVDTSDTDHFDTSIILHEYGHFMEDVYGKTDSPGGFHTGDAIIDPRLAWSEGWANFFQAAALGTTYYLDTSGFCNDSVEGGNCSQNIFFSLRDDGTTTLFDRPSQQCIPNTSSCSNTGEGTFREVSISRTLHKIISAKSATYPFGAGIPFKELWNVFSDGTTGYHSSGQTFRSILLMNKSLDQVITNNYSSSVTSWNAILANEQQLKVVKSYNNPLVEQTYGTCAATTIYPSADYSYCTSDGYCPFYKMSNQHRSNDFYNITVTQSDVDAGASINLTYTQVTPSSPVDLDIYLYKQGYLYFEEYQEKESGEQSPYIVKRSARTNPTFESGSESFSLSQIPPGVYLLVVKASTFNKTNASVGIGGSYTLTKTVNSSQRDLCPAN